MLFLPWARPSLTTRNSPANLKSLTYSQAAPHAKSDRDESTTEEMCFITMKWWLSRSTMWPIVYLVTVKQVTKHQKQPSSLHSFLSEVFKHHFTGQQQISLVYLTVTITRHLFCTVYIYMYVLNHIQPHNLRQRPERKTSAWKKFPCPPEFHG